MLITAALPYAEDKPHIGNLFTLVAADVAAKFYKILGRETLFVTGSDEHGTPISLKAELKKISPQELVDENCRLLLEQLELLGIEPDSFARTSSELNKRLTQEIFLELLRKGYIKLKETLCYYDPVLQRFLPDRYVKGTCPYCGARDQYSDHCDACGRYLKTGEIKEPYSVLSGSKVELRRVKHAFFDLSKVKPRLKQYIEQELEMEEGLKKYVLELLEKIDEWDITRNMEWGTPVPLEELQDQVFYVWFDAPVGYLTAVLQLGEEKFRQYWQDAAYIIHIIGKDIVYHHAIFWLGMLLALEKYTLPRRIYAHGYITLEHQKISKSRGHVLYADDFARAGINPEYLRYYLATLHTGKVKDTDFSLQDFAAKINNCLVADYANLCYRVLKLAETRLGGKLVKAELDEWLVKEYEHGVSEYLQFMQEFNFCEADKVLSRLAGVANKFLNEREPWKERNPAQTLYCAACACAWLSTLYYPFIPKTALKVLGLLGVQQPSIKLVARPLELKEVRCERIAEKVPANLSLEFLRAARA